MKWLTVSEMIKEMLSDDNCGISKYGNWIFEQDTKTIQAIYFQWHNNKTRIKNGIKAKTINLVLDEDHLDLNKDHFRINPETGEYEVLTDLGNWETYID